jgi:hypothetical protein
VGPGATGLAGIAPAAGGGGASRWMMPGSIGESRIAGSAGGLPGSSLRAAPRARGAGSLPVLHNPHQEVTMRARSICKLELLDMRPDANAKAAETKTEPKRKK